MVRVARVVGVVRMVGVVRFATVVSVVRIGSAFSIYLRLYRDSTLEVIAVLRIISASVIGSAFGAFSCRSRLICCFRKLSKSHQESSASEITYEIINALRLFSCGKYLA